MVDSVGRVPNKLGFTWTLGRVSLHPSCQDCSGPSLSIAVDSAVPTTAYLTFTGFTFGIETAGHVFRTKDAGATWADISGNLPSPPVYALVVDPLRPDTLYIGTDIGAFFTPNGGRRWQRLSRGRPPVPVVDLKLHEATRMLRAATHGRGMWDLALPDREDFR